MILKEQNSNWENIILFYNPMTNYDQSNYNYKYTNKKYIKQYILYK